jgi:probable DNA repair protein
MSDELIFFSIDASKAAAYLSGNVVLCTASSQLAAGWKERLVSGADNMVCATPNVFSWQAWISALAAGQDTMPVALNRMQENWLWEQVIRSDLLKSSDLPGQSTASVRGLAGHAREAYALMREYRIDIGELAFSGQESDALVRWISAVHKKLGEGDLSGRILAADVGRQLLQCIDHIEKPESILLAGFDVFTPMQQALLTALQESGVVLAQVKHDAALAECALYACSDAQAECSHIAMRVKDVLKNMPLARIGIVISEAVTDISVLKRMLNDVLMPELRCEPAQTMQAVVIAGEPLSDHPMIWQLLHMLALCGEFSLSFDAFSSLLFSPWLKGYEAERFERARLDARFRQRNRHRLTFKSLLNTADVQAMPELLSALKAMAGWNRNKRSANDWVKVVHELLKRTGFVRLGSDKTGSDNEVPRSNHEIRQMNAFRDVLISLVAVDAVAEGASGHASLRGSLTWMQFLSLLRTGCSECQFAEMVKYANVMVLPLSQISGLQFDYLFVMGMDEEAFPPPARPCPLLPASVQKKYALPMSSGALVYASAQRLWDAVLQSAPHIEASCARQRDGRELLPSSFVADLEAQPCEMVQTDVMRLPTEVFDDVSNVPLSSAEHVRGGTSIIRNQSACPFRAFATHRLGISPLGETSPGIEPSSKGSLIHLALEYIWRKLERQSALAALNDDETAALIDAAINHAWTEAYVMADSRTRDCEKKRMQSVLLAWLELELQRPEFRVTAIEKSFQLRLPEVSEFPLDGEVDATIEVNIKADRMDVDATGRNILIDYKTGAKQSTAKWLVDEEAEGRIEEPQLPQYALAADLGVDDAVAFARVRSGDMAYEGLCGEEIGIDGIAACDGKRGRPDDWQDVLDDWKTHINALAMEFVEGRCDVSPRDEHACNYCGLEAVCRIEEKG